MATSNHFREIDEDARDSVTGACLENSSKESTAAERWEVLCLFGIFALALGIRCIGLGRLSLWTDEIHTLYMTRFDLMDFFAFPALADHPPLYFLLMKGWLRAGDGEAWVRGLSALAGALAVVPVYLAARKIGGRFYGLVCALFLALSPVGVMYSQEARGYSLLLLLAANQVCLLLFLMDNPSRRKQWLFAINGALLLSCHSVGALYLACFLPVFLMIRADGKAVRALAGAFGRTAIVSLPAAALLAQQFLLKNRSGFWQTPPNAWVVLDTIRQFFTLHFPSIEYLIRKLTGLSLPYAPLENYIYIPFVLLLFLALPECCSNRRLRIAAGVSALYFFLLWLVSRISVPAFALRTALPALPGVLLLLGAPVILPSNRAFYRAKTALLVFCICLSAIGTYTDFKQLQKEDWRGLAATLRREIEPPDTILHWRYLTGLGLEHYARRQGIPNPIVGVPQGYEEAVFTPDLSILPPGLKGRLSSVLKSKGRVWVVSLKGDREYGMLEEELRRGGYGRAARHEFLSLWLIRYERAGEE